MTPQERMIDAMTEIRASKDMAPAASQWHLIDQSRIDAFADLTGDHQFIHVDPGRSAEETPFGSTIAHGFLTLALASRFYQEAIPTPVGLKLSLNYGFDRVRFLTPVPEGTEIRGVFQIQSVIPRGDTRLMTDHALTIEIMGLKRPALSARWLNLLEF